MPNTTLQLNFSGGGVSIQGRVIRDGEGGIGQTVSVPAGSAGELTTRTDNDTGVVTAEAGHGLITGHKVDVVWTTGGGGSRTNMSATVATNAITLDGGAGDNLPTLNDDVMIYRRMVITQTIPGDDVSYLAAMLPVAGVLSMKTSAPVSTIDNVALVANEPWNWILDTGAANPLAGVTIATVEVANRTTTASTFKLCGQYDSTP